MRPDGLHRRRARRAHHRAARLLLQKADVVIFDHLVIPSCWTSRRRMPSASTSARRRPSSAIRTRSAILLVEKAREGKTVARLKWGDPFLFDRGGEEALFLHEQGVHFEVVPGVPAAIGAATPSRHSDHLSRRRRHGDVRARPRRRRTPRKGQGELGEVWPSSTARSCATPGRSSCPNAPVADGNGRSPDERRRSSCRHAVLATHPDRHAAGAGRPTQGASGHRSGAANRRQGRSNFRDHLRWFDLAPLFGAARW